MLDGSDWGRLAYLLLLLAAVGVIYVGSHRPGRGAMLRHTAVWSLVFLAVAAGFGLWEDLRHSTPPRQAVMAGGDRIEVARHADGHYYLTLDVEGVPVRFVVDTGATDLVLTRQDALRVGLNPDALVYQGRARTANGEVRTARVRLSEVSLGAITDTRVTAWVNEGPMDISLLGMAYLQRFERIEISGDRLVLVR